MGRAAAVASAIETQLHEAARLEVRQDDPIGEQVHVHVVHARLELIHHRDLRGCEA